MVQALSFLSECARRPLSAIARDIDIGSLRYRSGSDSGFNIHNAGERIGLSLDFAITIAGTLVDVSYSLQLMSNFDPFIPIARVLESAPVYHFIPGDLKKNQYVSSERYLEADALNIFAIIDRMSTETREGQLPEWLRAVAPNIAKIGISQPRNDFGASGAQLTLQMQQTRIDGSKVTFQSKDMSDGTLYALPIIVVALQDPMPSVVVIEEPERHVHIVAMGAIAELLEMISEKTQLIVTTHSPDLLEKMDKNGEYPPCDPGR